MGCFDSLYIQCPNCGKQLEFQSKSGPCALERFNQDNLPIEIAVGMNGDVAKCEFCNINWELKFNFPFKIESKLIMSDKEADYSGNYNSKLESNIKKIERITKRLGDNIK